jgi:hypothetical protein
VVCARGAEQGPGFPRVARAPQQFFPRCPKQLLPGSSKSKSKHIHHSLGAAVFISHQETRHHRPMLMSVAIPIGIIEIAEFSASSD